MPTRPTTQESNSPPVPPSPETIVRRIIDDAFSLGRLEVAEELIAVDCVEHQDFGPEHPPGPRGVKTVIASLHHAFSDYRLTIEAMSVQGDVVWTRNVATGTHDGPFKTYAPTARPMRVTVFDVFRVSSGKVVEHWGLPDRFGLLVQLGLLPHPPR